MRSHGGGPLLARRALSRPGSDNAVGSRDEKIKKLEACNVSYMGCGRCGAVHLKRTELWPRLCAAAAALCYT